jgi:hypothetical protein
LWAYAVVEQITRLGDDRRRHEQCLTRSLRKPPHASSVFGVALVAQRVNDVRVDEDHAVGRLPAKPSGQDLIDPVRGVSVAA